MKDINHPYRLTDEQYHTFKGVADTLYTLAGMGKPNDYRNEDAMTGCLAMLSDHMEALLEAMDADSKSRHG